MKILYDHQAFDMQNHGGVSRCFVELHKHRPAAQENVFGVVETDNVYLQELGFPIKGETFKRFWPSLPHGLRKFGYKLHYNCKFGHYKQWDQRPDLNRYCSEWLLKQSDFDVFHPTFFEPYFLPLLGNKPFVLTIHDMIAELYPQYYGKDNLQIVYKQLLAPKAAHIVAVSEQTKQDILRFIDVPEEKISVVYHGCNETPYSPSAQAPFDFEYILYVGERHYYKNFDQWVRQCRPLLERHADLRIVCTGKAFSSDELALFDSLGISGRMVHTFPVAQQDFMDLYHYALCFAYPSEYEGFGIPILEAYEAGCPVMLSRKSCFPEVAGDAAIYFDLEAEDFGAQFETLYHLTTDERAALIANQDQRRARYSWQESARQLSDIYQKL